MKQAINQTIIENYKMKTGYGVKVIIVHKWE